MASSNPVPCRGIIQTVVFVGIYWTGYGGCTQPAWPPFGVTNTNTIFNKYTCGSFTNMNTVYHNIHLHCTHWSSWRTVLPFLSITNEYVENGYCRFLFIEELKAGSQIGCWITRIMICQKKTAWTRLIAWVTGQVRPKALYTNAKKQWEIWPKIKVSSNLDFSYTREDAGVYDTPKSSLYIGRLEICRDRWDRRSCKIFPTV